MLDRGSAMRDGFGCCFGVGLLMVAGAAFGQTAAGNPGQAAAGKLAFVSATVKPSAPVTIDSAHAASAQFEADVKAGKVKLQPGVMVNTTHPRMGAHVDASQAEYNFLPLIDLIAIAYNVKVNQVSGPDWINGQRFDIVAKMPGGAFIADASNMLQALLEDRFALLDRSFQLTCEKMCAEKDQRSGQPGHRPHSTVECQTVRATEHATAPASAS
jgi:hypothetical protein